MRLFVALELPPDVRAALVGWRPVDDALRPVGAEDLHVTLAFLGERSEAEATAVARVLGSVARPVEGLTLGPPRWLPPRRPRVLAVEIADGDGALTALHFGLVGALGDAIAYRPDRRRFLPHVTVARIPSPPTRSAEPGLDPPPAGPPFAAPALTLYRSRLEPGGARYEALERALLTQKST